MLGADVGQFHIPACRGGGRKVSRRRDAVRNHPVLGRMQLFDSGNVQISIRCDAHARAAGIEKCGQIADLRFTRRIFDHSFPLGQCGGDHDIFRRADARERQGDPRAAQTVADGTLQITVILLDRHPKLFKSGQMQVDRTRSQFTAAGHGNTRAAAFCDNRAEKDD